MRVTHYWHLLALVLLPSALVSSPQVEKGKAEIGKVAQSYASPEFASEPRPGRKSVLSDKEVMAALQRAEKLGTLKIGGGTITGPYVTFEPGSSMLRTPMTWCSSGSLYYYGAQGVGPTETNFVDAIGTPETRAIGVNLFGLRAHLVVVELLVDSDRNTQLQVRQPTGDGPIQTVHAGNDQTAVFAIEPTATTGNARIIINILSTHRCTIRQVTVRPVG